MRTLAVSCLLGLVAVASRAQSVVEKIQSANLRHANESDHEKVVQQQTKENGSVTENNEVRKKVLHLSTEKVYPNAIAGRTLQEPWRVDTKSHMENAAGTPGWKEWAQNFEKSAYRTLTSSMSQIMSLYIILLSLLTLIPFGWFTFAGQSPDLHKYYMTTTVGFATQTLLVSILDTLNWPDVLIVTVCVSAVALQSWWCWTRCECQCCQTTLDIWFGVVLITFFLVMASPFIVLNNQYVFWVLVILLAYVLTYAYPMLPYEQVQVTGFKIALSSSYGLTSAICVLMSLFGVNGSFDFVTFFSVPSSFAYTNANTVYTLIFVTAVAFGTYVNSIRDKKLQV